MALTVACVNLKGGVGKTAIAVNLAAYCGAQGHRTLLVDLDPQTNATFSCVPVEKWQSHAANHGTVANLLGVRNHTSAEGRTRTIQEVILSDVFPGVDLIPSHLELFTIDLDLASAIARETLLKRALAPVVANYDIIICDCPPNLTLPTQNALAASSHYVVPISPDFLSGIGVGLLISRIREICESLDHPLTLAGIVVSRAGRPAAHRREVIAALRQQFGQDVLETEIQERVAVSRAAAENRPIYDAGDVEAAAQFTAVSQDLLERFGL